MAACVAAVFFWNHKQRLIAQKETIIQESEYLVGFPDLALSTKHETTFNRLTRVQTLSRIKEDRPDDPSFKRMVKLRSKLEEIQGLHQEYGYNVRTIGGFDPNKSLTFHTHIETLGSDLTRRKDQIQDLRNKNEELEEDLVVQKTLLGQEIEKVSEARATIVENEAIIEDLEGKYGQLEDTYEDTLIQYQQKIQELHTIYKAKGEVAARQNRLLKAQLNEAVTKIALMNQLLEHNKRTDIEKGENGNQSGKVYPIRPNQQDANPNNLHTRFYKYSPSENRIALLAGDSSGIQAYTGKPLTLLVGDRQVKGLQIVKVSK